MAPDGTVTILHSFGATAVDGYNPTGFLIDGSDGKLYGITSNGGAHDAGTVFRISIGGGDYTVLHSFGATASDGAHPVGGLRYTSGFLYGVTASGGANTCPNVPARSGGGNCGTVFQVSPEGVAETLYSFGATPTDGVTPSGPLLLDRNEYFLGTTSYGGSFNGGTIYQFYRPGFDLPGRVVMGHSFGETATDGLRPHGLLVHLPQTAGVYGTTRAGGTAGRGTAFTVRRTGDNERTLYSFGSSTLDGYIPSPLYISNFIAGHYFIGTTSEGGASGGGTAFSMDTLGIVTVLYAFGASASDPRNPEGSLILNNGELYGVALNGGANGAGAIFKLVKQ